MKEKIAHLLTESRRQALTRQCGGQGQFIEHLEGAMLAARVRFPEQENKAVAFAIISLVRRCGSKPSPEDIARFTDAGETSKPISKPKGTKNEERRTKNS